jgi:hypothetical protein
LEFFRGGFNIAAADVLLLAVEYPSDHGGIVDPKPNI